MNPLFSIIVPVYKVEKYLIQCLDSIINQKYSNFELILVDDGSPDSCPSVCDIYANNDLRIRVIHTENGGPIKARKTGVAMAIGTYLVFVDGDDWLDTNYLQKFAEQIKISNMDIICCGAVWTYGDKYLKKTINNCSFGYYDREKITKEIFPILIESKNGTYFTPTVWGKAFKKSLYIKGELSEGTFRMGEDIACVKPALFYANSIYILSECLYFYRQNVCSLTNQKGIFDWNGPELIAKHLEKCIPMDQFDFQAQLYRNLVHNIFNVAVSQFNITAHYSDVKKKIIKRITQEYYKTAINKCKYTFCKGLLVKYCLKYHFIFLISLYCKFK